MKLLGVYTQKELLGILKKDALAKYRITKESAELAEEWELFIQRHQDTLAARHDLRNRRRLKPELYNFVNSAGRNHSPIWNHYLLCSDQNFELSIINVDFNNINTDTCKLGLREQQIRVANRLIRLDKRYNIV